MTKETKTLMNKLKDFEKDITNLKDKKFEESINYKNSGDLSNAVSTNLEAYSIIEAIEIFYSHFPEIKNYKKNE
jgi:hypothetical protein